MNRRWARVKPYCESLDFQQELKKKKRREEYLVFKMRTTLCILFISNAEYFVPLCFYFISKFDRGKNMFSYTMICMGQLTIRVRCLQKSGNTPSYVRLLTPPPNKPWNLKLSVVLWIPNGFRTFFVGVLWNLNQRPIRITKKKLQGADGNPSSYRPQEQAAIGSDVEWWGGLGATSHPIKGRPELWFSLADQRVQRSEKQSYICLDEALRS